MEDQLKALIQRVSYASVEVESKIVGKIGVGILIFLGVLQGDTDLQSDFLAEKIANFRIFPDSNQKMNLSVLDIHGEVLIVSQFTLAADGKKGNRPSFDLAASPDQALLLYKRFVEKIKSFGIHTETGIFGQHMHISLMNDGPVTFILEK